MKKVNLNDISMENKLFWYAYFATSYPNGWDEELNLSVKEILGERVDIEWWNDFVGYSDEIFEKNDGYLAEPVYIEFDLESEQKVKIEIHPGDTLYYINGKVVGSTGPHWELQVISHNVLEKLLESEDGKIMYWLLLPLAINSSNKVDEFIRILSERLEELFDGNICVELAKCIVNQLRE